MNRNMIVIGIILAIWDSFMLFSFYMVSQHPFSASGITGPLWLTSFMVTIIYLWEIGNDVGETFKNKDNK